MSTEEEVYSPWPREAMNLNNFFRLSEGQRICTRYMGPAIVLNPPLRIETEDGYNVIKDTCHVKLLRKCWKGKEEILTVNELTPYDPKMQV